MFAEVVVSGSNALCFKAEEPETSVDFVVARN